MLSVTDHLFSPMFRFPVLSTLFTVAFMSPLAGCSPADQETSTTTDISTSMVQERVESARSRLETSDGGRRILDAIEAHGGLEAWYEAPTSSYTWEYGNIGADLQFKSFLVADNSTRRVYHELLSVGSYGHPQPVDGRFAWDGTQAWIDPPEITAVNPRFWATSGYYFEQIPFVFADPGLKYEVLDDDTLGGRTYHLVRVSFDQGIGDSPGDTYVAYIDRETKRIGAVRYTVSYGRPPTADPPRRETLFEYHDYATVDGLTVATRFRGYDFGDGQKGVFRNEAWADSISFRRPFDESRLARPDGARIVPLPGE